MIERMLPPSLLLLQFIRHPLRKWWCKTGWLLLIPVIIAMVVKAYVEFIAFIAIDQLLPSNWCMADLRSISYLGWNYNSWGGVSEVTCLFARFSLVIACLGSASVANGLVTRALRELPAPQLREYLCARYSVMLLAILPAIASAVLLWLGADWLIHSQTSFGGFSYEAAADLVSINTLLPAQLWVLALLALQPARPWLAWLWGLSQWAVSMAIGAYADLCTIAGGYDFWTQRPMLEYRLPEIGWHWELGGLVVIMMLYCFGRRLLWPAYFLLALCMASAVANDADNILLYPPKAVQLAGKLEQPLMVGISALHGPSDFTAEFVADQYSMSWRDTAFSTIQLKQPFRIKLTLWKTWRYLFIPFNLLYLATVMFFISRVLIPAAVPRRI